MKKPSELKRKKVLFLLTKLKKGYDDEHTLFLSEKELNQNKKLLKNYTVEKIVLNKPIYISEDKNFISREEVEKIWSKELSFWNHRIDKLLKDKIIDKMQHQREQNYLFHINKDFLQKLKERKLKT